jgi:selenide,water dikinase
MPAQTDARILIDFRTSDDAGVYAWDDRAALVQTVDFFTPIVDDPYLYGQIAAANALSDVYAMGGTPMTALAIAAFPTGVIEAETITAIFLGGLDKLREAGTVLLGGHTVQDPEIKFGYAVTGVVDPRRMLANAHARPGDALLLTKPLGTGVVATAIKFARAPTSTVHAAVQSMVRLNKRAAEVLTSRPPGQVHACTDVTGFGLIGHAHRMAAAGGVALEIDARSVPILDGAGELVTANRAGGLATNRSHFGADVETEGAVDPEILALLYDPQTSGGLLAAVAPEHVEDIVGDLRAAGEPAVRIGRVGARNGAPIRVR